MASWDGLNRRKFPRVNYPCLVVVKDGEEKAEAFLTHTENVGLGGVCVIMKKNLKIFTSVDVELDLLDFGDHICCKGKIVWNVRRTSDASTKPLYYDIGIEFENLHDKETERLATVVQNLLKKNKEVPYR
jgi:Tfp pilus assembly protein PilZ